MIIQQSEAYNVYMFKDSDYKYRTVYTVKYGLQVEKFETLQQAMNNYANCLQHAVTCDQGGEQ